MISHQSAVWPYRILSYSFHRNEKRPLCLRTSSESVRGRSCQIGRGSSLGIEKGRMVRFWANFDKEAGEHRTLVLLSGNQLCAYRLAIDSCPRRPPARQSYFDIPESTPFEQSTSTSENYHLPNLSRKSDRYPAPLSANLSCARRFAADTGRAGHPHEKPTERTLHAASIDQRASGNPRLPSGKQHISSRIKTTEMTVPSTRVHQPANKFAVFPPRSHTFPTLTNQKTSACGACEPASIR